MSSFELQRKSDLSGVYATMVIPMDELVFEACHEAWQNGAFIQDAFPMLSDDEREFIKSGITAEEWDAVFSEEE